MYASTRARSILATCWRVRGVGSGRKPPALSSVEDDEDGPHQVSSLMRNQVLRIYGASRRRRVDFPRGLPARTRLRERFRPVWLLGARGVLEGPTKRRNEEHARGKIWKPISHTLTNAHERRTLSTPLFLSCIASSATNTRHVRRFGDFFAREIEASVSSSFHGAGRLNACTRDHRPESRGLLCSRDAPFFAKPTTSLSVHLPWSPFLDKTRVERRGTCMRSTRVSTTFDFPRGMFHASSSCVTIRAIHRDHEREMTICHTRSMLSSRIAARRSPAAPALHALLPCPVGDWDARKSASREVESNLARRRMIAYDRDAPTCTRRRYIYDGVSDV